MQTMSRASRIMQSPQSQVSPVTVRIETERGIPRAAEERQGGEDRADGSEDGCGLKRDVAEGGLLAALPGRYGDVAGAGWVRKLPPIGLRVHPAVAGYPSVHT